MKSNLELVQELLESKFDSLDGKVDDGLSNLNDKIDNNNKHVIELLSLIREQTTKTNGRVFILENDIKTVTTESSHHLINCPRVKEINDINVKLEKLNEENLILKIWNKYPKQLLAFFVLTVVITLSSVAYTIIEFRKAVKEIAIENFTEDNK